MKGWHDLHFNELDLPLGHTGMHAWTSECLGVPNADL